jgi:hypothetical protein
MKPAEAEPVKLFVAALYSEVELLKRALTALEERFGGIDFKSPDFEFNVTDYYREEMGQEIYRKIVSFRRLINPKDIAKIKIATNEIEDGLAADGKRKVNLDAGYLDFHKVILASAKFNGQKIYLDLGIYADPTLWYEHGEFRAYRHTFPDFKTGIYNHTFLHIRALFKGQRRQHEES